MENNKKTGPFTDLGCSIFSLNGKKMAYKAKLNDDWYVFEGKNQSEPFSSVMELKYSEDAKYLLCSVQKESRKCILINNNIVGIYDNVFDIQVLQGGKGFLCEASIDERTYSKVFIDGKEYTGALSRQGVVYVNEGKIMMSTF